MDFIIIVALIIFLFFIYKTGRAIEIKLESEQETREKIVQSLEYISNSIYDLKNKENDILNSLLNLPTIDEINKKRETFTKLYANYLVNYDSGSLAFERDKVISQEDALLQANFEIDKFGIEKVLNDINWDKVIKNKDIDSERDLINSNFFKNEIEKFWTVGNGNDYFISPVELFLPIYKFFKNYEYKEGGKIELNKAQDDDYYSYIKNRAVLYNLEKMGVIKFTEQKNSGEKFNSSFTFISSSIEEIKKIINKAYLKRGHQLDSKNDWYDERIEDEHGELFRRT